MTPGNPRGFLYDYLEGVFVEVYQIFLLHFPELPSQSGAVCGKILRKLGAVIWNLKGSGALCPGLHGKEHLNLSPQGVLGNDAGFNHQLAVLVGNQAYHVLNKLVVEYAGNRTGMKHLGIVDHKNAAGAVGNEGDEIVLVVTAYEALPEDISLGKNSQQGGGAPDILGNHANPALCYYSYLSVRRGDADYFPGFEVPLTVLKAAEHN